MKLLNIIFVTYQILIIHGFTHQFSSTIEALLNGKNTLCLGDCSGSKGHELCVYDWDGNGAQCSILTNPDHVTPKLTKRYRTIDNELCYSNCYKYENKNYDWCVTNENGKIDWNYCSRKIALKGKQTYKTDNEYLTCTDECAKRSKSYNWCNTVDNWQYCDPAKKVLVFNFPTESGKDCVTPCSLYKSKPYCYDSDGKWKKCYQNPDSTHELSKMSHHLQGTRAPGEYTSHGYKICKRVSKREIFFTHPLNVEEVARQYEEDFPTIDVRHIDPNNMITNDRDPVISYTVLNTFSDFSSRQVNLPLVIRALITNNTLRRPGEREDFTAEIRNHYNELHPINSDDHDNYDEMGHLVASRLGGPTETYNIFPQSWRHNRGRMSRWQYMETDLFNFINTHTNSYAEYTVVVSYDLEDAIRPNRPTAVGMRIRLFNGNAQLCDVTGAPVTYNTNVLDNMYFTNNPDHSCIIEGDASEDGF